MTEISSILYSTSHRPFPIPRGPWIYYQEWYKSLFLHWKVSLETLRNCVPEKLKIDTFEGDCYVSLVAFTMQKIRPRFLPPVKAVSDFHEINLRTYIDIDSRPGIYFLSIEAGKYLSSFISRALSGLPYEKADIKRTDNKYESINKTKGFHLHTEFQIGERIINKTNLDTWLAERYCLYLDMHEKVYRYDIHHKEWEVKKLDIKSLQVCYKANKMILSDVQPKLTHYSEGVKVLGWSKKLI